MRAVERRPSVGATVALLDRVQRRGRGVPRGTAGSARACEVRRRRRAVGGGRRGGGSLVLALPRSRHWLDKLFAHAAVLDSARHGTRAATKARAVRPSSSTLGTPRPGHPPLDRLAVGTRRWGRAERALAAAAAIAGARAGGAAAASQRAAGPKPSLAEVAHPAEWGLPSAALPASQRATAVVPDLSAAPCESASAALDERVPEPSPELGRPEGSWSPAPRSRSRSLSLSLCPSPSRHECSPLLNIPGTRPPRHAPSPRARSPARTFASTAAASSTVTSSSMLKPFTHAWGDSLTGGSLKVRSSSPLAATKAAGKC